MFKIIITFIFLFCITSSFVNAQENFIVGIFNNIPVSDYASTDYQKNTGFAKDGWGIMIEQKITAEIFPQGLSVGLHLSSHLNELNSSGFTRALEKALGDQFVVYFGLSLEAGRIDDPFREDPKELIYAGSIYWGADTFNNNNFRGVIFYEIIFPFSHYHFIHTISNSVKPGNPKTQGYCFNRY